MAGLIEGLPDAVALRCLARVPYHLHPKLELVSRCWRAAIHSAELFRARQEVGSSEELLCVCCYNPNNTWQLYDPLRDLWMSLPKLPSKRSHLTNFGAVSTSQKLFVLGGWCDVVNLSTGERDGKSRTNEVWSYDFVTRIWLMQAPMLFPRAMFACCVLDGKIVVAGGFTHQLKPTATVEMYDPEKDSWARLPDLLQTPNSPCIGAVIRGKMNVIHQDVSMVQIFNNLEQKWRVEDYGLLPGHKAVVRDSIYVMSQGQIFKLDVGGEREFIVSASQFNGRMGMAMIGFRDEVYVIGGVVQPENWNMDLKKFSEVQVLRLNVEKPTWYNVTPMTRCHGSVLGCTQLRI